jgi:probable rRNA maturation factor
MRKSAHLEVTRRARIWSPPAGELSVWAHAALGRRARGAELALRVVGTTESRRLNAHYRGKDAPTNVLSFPAQPLPATRKGATRPLGDLVICARVLRREARVQGKSLRAHWAHLVVHGALHLIGYDHERARDARRMERREISVLRSLGFANPYRSA